MPRENPAAVTYFAATDFRNAQKRFGIKAKDRLKHMYVIGKTGVGKSTMIENMIAQDIATGNGLAFLDPHGASAEKMLDYIPPHRIDDVIYFAPFDMAYPVAFNVMEDVGEDKRHHVANGILSVMKKIWVDSFSGRMEYLTQNVLLALLEFPDATLLGFNRVLTDKEYRGRVVDNIKDPSVKDFWVNDYGKWDDRYRREAGASIQNKIGQFTSNPLIRNIIGQPKSSFDLNEVMDQRKILIANFSKGLLGEQNAQLLGSMLSTKIYLAAMSRAQYTEDQIAELPSFYLYVDEFQNFANDSFANVLAEARKYKLSLTMAHQFIAQVPEAVQDAIFGNVGTMIVFRIGPQDAEKFEQEFAPEFFQQDMVNLGFAQIYLKLSIDGMSSRAFSARTIPPIAKPEVSVKEAVFQRSRQNYANRREDVETAIEEWYVPIPSEKQIEHHDYLQQKKAEIEAKGGIWVDYSKYPELKGLPADEAAKKVAEIEGKPLPKKNKPTFNKDNLHLARRPGVPADAPAVISKKAPVKSPPVHVATRPRAATPTVPSSQTVAHIRSDSQKVKNTPKKEVKENVAPKAVKKATNLPKGRPQVKSLVKAEPAEVKTAASEQNINSSDELHSLLGQLEGSYQDRTQSKDSTAQQSPKSKAGPKPRSATTSRTDSKPVAKKSPQVRVATAKSKSENPTTSQRSTTLRRAPLAKKKTKDASAGSISALRDVLKKAKSSHAVEKKASAIQKPQTISLSDLTRKTPNASTSLASGGQNNYNSKHKEVEKAPSSSPAPTHKEIPEDVLRDLLE